MWNEVSDEAKFAALFGGMVGTVYGIFFGFVQRAAARQSWRHNALVKSIVVCAFGGTILWSWSETTLYEKGMVLAPVVAAILSLAAGWLVVKTAADGAGPLRRPISEELSINERGFLALGLVVTAYIFGHVFPLYAWLNVIAGVIAVGVIFLKKLPLGLWPADQERERLFRM